MQNSNLIKSKKRVIENGEVFTSKKEVNAMLDLVFDEALRVDSRFLEPACGDGNFLNEILERRLKKVFSIYNKNDNELEHYSFISVASLYGIDILEDNVIECRARMLKTIENFYKTYNKLCIDEFVKAIQFVLRKNIVHGDALSLCIPDSSTPIIFSEWSSVNHLRVGRTDYTLANLLAYQPFDEDNLFSDLGDKAFIPKPQKKYPLVKLKEVPNYD